MSFFDLSGKKALITGGNSGIGLAVTRRFIHAGVDVVALDINCGDDLKHTSAHYLHCDVADPASVEAAFRQAAERLGTLDIVVNNAGIAPETGPIQGTDIEAARATIEVNLNGVMWGLRFAPEHMTAGGTIINTASAAATIGFPTYGPYAASKGGVVSLTKAAAVDLGPLGIRVNAVCPGTVVTPLQPADDAEGVFFNKASPLGRIGHTDDLVGLYHFLAADESAWMTGQAVYLDGGVSAGFSMPLVEAEVPGEGAS